MKHALIPSIILVGSFVSLAGCGGGDEPDPAESLFQPKLSAYPFFDGAAALQRPAANVIPYDVNSTLYADGAQKLRFIAIPSGKKIHFDPAGRWTYPEGTTLIKSFYYDHDQRDASQGRKLLETRLIQMINGAWNAVTYVWNDAQTDADRFVAGKAVHVDYTDEAGTAQSVDYHVPSTSQCKSCHGQSKKIAPLGPRTRQLNRAHDYGAGAENQIAHLKQLGLFDGDVPDPATLDRLDDPHGNAPVESRARAWLDANCAHCHNEEGYASSTALRLERETTDAVDLGVCRHPAAAGPAAGGFSYDVVPGKPDQSILIFRMKSNDPKTKMPQLPLTTIDRFGVQLVSDWIAGLNGACN